MTISAYAIAIETVVPMLRTLSALLDKGAAHAAAKSFDPSVLANGRLAPNMFPLIKQVQIACDHAKGVAARLSGQEAPRFEDNEQTIEDLKARIARTLDYVESVPASAFEGSENRTIAFPLRDTLSYESNGLQYIRDWVLPHFYFHVVTAYDILRHNGVEIGKRDYVAHIGALLKENG